MLPPRWHRRKLKAKIVDVEGGGIISLLPGVHRIIFDGFTRIYEEEKEDAGRRCLPSLT
ncbi:MAG: hypothetical protein MZU91_10540 [Desulfosudis oleivorans]|nr:hypothetical protein [Desulfosudis oleivorans]